MSWRTVLRLGRVSNLPTIWTNTLTGIVLAGGMLADPRSWPLLLALSLFYVGGMYLNDAFDAEIDARERPDRPIPAGLIAASTVYAIGFGLLGLGLLGLVWAGFVPAGGTGGWPGLAGLVLAATIVIYDWHHKDNPLSPLFMGVCRMLVYLTAGLAFQVPPPNLLMLAALLLLSYLIGLTYIAKQETLAAVENLWPLLFLAPPLVYALAMAGTSGVGALAAALLAACVAAALWLLRRRRPGDVPRAVVTLIAGICLLDAVLIASAGAVGLAWLAIGAFALTLALQRLVPGT